MASHFYLHSTVKLPYTVTVQPPPADVTATYHQHTQDGCTLGAVDSLGQKNPGSYDDHSLVPSDKGFTLANSPIVVEFVAELTDKSKKETAYTAFELAEPAVMKIKAPADAKVGDTIDLEVETWGAVVHREGSAAASPVEEKTPDRIKAEDKQKVAWQVDGEAIAGDPKGEKVQLEITEEHQGKTLLIEGYLGDAATGWAQAAVIVPKLEIMNKDMTAPGPEFVFIDHISELALKVEPAVEAEKYVWSVEGDKAGLLDVSAEDTAATQAEVEATVPKVKLKGLKQSEDTEVTIKCKLVSKATQTEHEAEHKVKVREVTPVVIIEALDKWFLPKSESCDVKYSLQQGKKLKGKLEVHPSNYCKGELQADGKITYTKIEGKPVFSKDLAEGTLVPAPPPPEPSQPPEGEAPQAKKEEFEVKDWKGKVDVTEGMLKPASGDRFINVAFSPYTIHVRYLKKDSDAKARIDLKPFWPRWDKTSGDVVADSMKIKWKVSDTGGRLKKGELRIVDKADKLVFKKELAEGDLSDGDHEHTWDKKVTEGDNAGTEVDKAHMPYRVQVYGHTDDKEATGPIGLAAMHTEVRAFAHPDTGTHKDEPEKDTNSLELSLAPYVTKVPDKGADEDKWYQHQLALGGFHPGPINGTIGSNETKTALQEFQRSKPKVSTESAGTVAGINASTPSNGDKKIMSDSGTLTAGTALTVVVNDLVQFDGTKWTRIGGKFSRLPHTGTKDADTKGVLETLAADTRPLFGDYGSKGDLAFNAAKPVLADKAQTLIVWVDDRHYYTSGDVGAMFLDHYHGAMSIGDSRIARDQSAIARPWLPLEAAFPIRKKDTGGKGLEDLAAEKPSADAEIRKLMGPLRVNWTFREIGEDLDAIDTSHASYLKSEVRSRECVKQITEAEKSTHDGKDYTNCPDKDSGGGVDMGGIRPRAAMATYYKVPFGLSADTKNLEPWRSVDDTTEKKVYALIHDDLGEGFDAAKLHADWVGKSGIYFNTSRIAGDGYQVRAQLNFKKTDSEFPNREPLEHRYENIEPQAHTAKLRLWRKTSARGYMYWGPTAGGWPGYLSTAAGLYAPAQLHVVHQDGSAGNFTVTDYLSLSEYQNILTATVTDAHWSTVAVTLNAQYVWPWTTAPGMGFQPGGAGTTAANYYTRVIKASYTPTWRRFRTDLIHLLLKAVEENQGRLKGHFIVEFHSTPQVRIQGYTCSRAASHGCGQTRAECINNVPAGSRLTGTACPSAPCAAAGGVMQVSGGVTTYAKVGLPAVGVSMGACWVYTNSDATKGPATWAHEIGHHRHLQHARGRPGAAAAPGAQAQQHDSANCPSLASEAQAHNRGWDRDCDMSYYKGNRYFCGKCLLKNRGWAIESPTVANPNGNLMDATVELTHPTGGEVLKGTVNITWVDTDDRTGTVKIELSSDSGASWTTVLQASANTAAQSWSWDTTGTADDNKFRIQLTPSNSVPVQGVAVSSTADFIISNGTPVIALSAPNGDEKLKGTVEIQWTTTDKNPEWVKIEVSKDSGSTWTVVEAAAPDTGKYEWDTTGQDDGDKYRIQVTPTNKGGNAGTAKSSAKDFAIYNKVATATLTAPNGDEQLSGSTDITWDTDGTSSTKVKIEYSKDSGSTWTQLVAEHDISTKKYTWDTTGVDDGAAYRVRLTPKNPLGEEGTASASAKDFAIYNNAPTVTLEAPNGGEKLKGSTDVTWDTDATGDAKVKIEYSRDSGSTWTVLEAEHDITTKKYTWNTTGGEDAGTYRIRLTPKNPLGKEGTASTSASDFGVYNAAPACDLSSPDGGEVLQGTVDITWTTDNVSPYKVKIESSADSGGSWTTLAADQDLASKKYSWNTSGSADGSSYRVRLTPQDPHGEEGTASQSCSEFIISNGTPSIALTNPTAGMKVEGMLNIQWRTTDANPDTVKIELSADGGSTWSVLAAAAPDSGSSHWSSRGNADGENYKIRVTAKNKGGNTGSATSGAFKIANDAADE